VRRVDIATTAVVDRPVELTAGEPGTATIQARRPERIEVEVSAPTRQLLVLSESYYPGWTARSNGKPLPVIRAYGDFMACAVEPGHSHIVFCFEPVSFRRGAWVTLFSLAAVLMTFAFVFWLPAKLSAPGGKKEAAKDSAPDLASTRAKRRRHHRN
jgi:hypothetical protein